EGGYCLPPRRCRGRRSEPGIRHAAGDAAPAHPPAVDATHRRGGMIIAGSDLSLTRTGVALARSPERVETSSVVSKPPKTGTETLRSRFERMATIATEVLDTVGGAELVGIESPAYGIRNVGKVHDRSGLWWRIVAALEQRGVSVVEVSPPSRMMYATSTGKAGKDLVLCTNTATT